METITCFKCGSTKTPIFTWKRKLPNYEAIKSSCSECGAYIKFVPKTRENSLKANRDDSMHKPKSLF
jgi:formate dehydrogenase maturation protein FdhE